MSAAFQQIIENISRLSSVEKALAAHCLISAMETHQDEEVDQEWAELAKKDMMN